MVEWLRFDDNPVVIVRGNGAVEQVWALADGLDSRPPLVVCGETVAEQRWFGDIVHGGPPGMAVFIGVEPDPSDETILRGAAAARKHGCGCVIGVGGGSSMDAAKVIAAEAVAPGFVAAHDVPGKPTEISVPPLPVIVVPTTAGTASEVTPFCVVTYRASRRKLTLNHPALFPRYGVLDPELLTSAPARARAAAGMDALTHAIESFTSLKSTNESRARCISAIGDLAVALPGAGAEVACIADLALAQWAATVAGLAFTHTRLGIVHAMAVPLSALFGIPHGIANAVLLPYGMRFNAPAAGDLYAKVARAMWAEGRDAAEVVRELAQSLGIEANLKALGVDPAAIPDMVAEAMKTAHVKLNPREVTAEDMTAIYEQAYEGEDNN